VAWLSGAAFLLRKSIAEEVGYMDENFFLYSEDEDFFCRISKTGRLVYYFPQSTLVHCRSKSAVKASINLILESTKSRLHFYRKRYSGRLIIFVKFLLAYRLTLELLILAFASLVSKSSRPIIQRKLKFCKESLKALPHL
jgi:GT2 family glycosyltransferase